MSKRALVFYFITLFPTLILVHYVNPTPDLMAVIGQWFFLVSWLIIVGCIDHYMKEDK